MTILTTKMTALYHLCPFYFSKNFPGKQKKGKRKRLGEMRKPQPLAHKEQKYNVSEFYHQIRYTSSRSWSEFYVFCVYRVPGTMAFLFFAKILEQQYVLLCSISRTGGLFIFSSDFGGYPACRACAKTGSGTVCTWDRPKNCPHLQKMRLQSLFSQSRTAKKQGNTRDSELFML